jgi:hypothetical protein
LERKNILCIESVHDYFLWIERVPKKDPSSIRVHTQFSFLREWLDEVQLGEAGVKKLDSNLGIENVLETKKNLMEFVSLHPRPWSQKQYLLSVELTGASQLFLNPQTMFFFFQVLDMESLVRFNKKLANLVKFTLEK